MLELAVSSTAVQSVRTAGPLSPEFTSVQTGVPPAPLAVDSIHVSLGCPMPPKIVMASRPGSYTAVWPDLPAGAPAAPCATTLLQVGAPPNPLAFARTHTSLKSVVPSLPPNTITRLPAGL